jgi:hypothetical protein
MPVPRRECCFAFTAWSLRGTPPTRSDQALGKLTGARHAGHSQAKRQGVADHSAHGVLDAASLQVLANGPRPLGGRSLQIGGQYALESQVQDTRGLTR